MKLVLLGPPGTGKGTIAKFIEGKFSFEQVSTGDLLRAEVAKKTDLGLKVAPIMSSGKLVDDSLVLAVLRKKLGTVKNGFVLDGFPRNVEQGKLLDSMLFEMNISLDFVLLLDTSDEVIMKRLSARRQCTNCGRIYGLDVPSKKMGVCDDCGSKTTVREDDNPEVVKKRLGLYHSLTKPLIDFYDSKGLLVRVEGDRKLQEIFEEVQKIIEERKNNA